MRYTKPQLRQMDRCRQLLKQDILSEEDKEFILNHYLPEPGASRSGAFFTSLELAWDFAFEAAPGRRENSVVIDLCAGIGVLSYTMAIRVPEAMIICVEANPAYVAIGRKIVPEAIWIHGDVMDPGTHRKIRAALNGRRADVAYANPPFGSGVRSIDTSGLPQGAPKLPEFAVMQTAALFAASGVFLVPPSSAGFEYSGVPCYRELPKSNGAAFAAATRCEMSVGMGIDTTCYQGFATTNVRVEAVTIEYPAHMVQPQTAEQGALF